MSEDPMFGGNDDHYAGVGESALKIICGSHLLANKAEPNSVLDFACATGRVTRWLRAAFPSADLHVADINPDWVKWSAERFGATGWLSSDDFTTLHAPRQYDLIWCGSLVTHISAKDAELLMTKFHEWLTPSGIAIVTTHGRQFVENLLAGMPRYFSNDESTALVLSDFALRDYGYVPHPGQSHGISVNSLEWSIRVIRHLNARLIAISEHTWDNHQDAVAFQRTA